MHSTTPPTLDTPVLTDKPSFAEFFARKGASPTTRDLAGKNALHHILMANAHRSRRTMRLLISRAPSLVHQADSAGNQPLHYALRRDPKTEWI